MPSTTERQAAIDLTLRLADVAATGTGPIEIPPGKLLYVRGAGSATTGTVDTAGGWRHTAVPYLHEMWLDPGAPSR
jgi:hypothetical protein